MSTTILDDLMYTKDDEWIRFEGTEATVGITDYAQDSLSDLVYVELPAEGDEFGAGETFGVVESVKAAADLFMPVAGKIVAVNEDLPDTPEVLNQDPYGDGWMVKIRVADPDAAADLMDAAAYRQYCEERG
jgi:glycine cleavage system H protein